MRQNPAVFRAAHLHIYFNYLRTVGAPVNRELARSRLPTWIEETPDEYISLPLSLDLLMVCARDFEPTELGFHASDGLCAATVGVPLQRRLARSQTRFAGIDALVRAIHVEDSMLRSSVRLEGEGVRVIVDAEGFDKHPLLCVVEWQSIRGILLASGAPSGHDGAVREITFVSRFELPAAVQERWPDTRILSAQPHTSVLFDRELLAHPRVDDRTRLTGDPPWGENASTGDAHREGWTFSDILRALVRPYLRDGYPDLAVAAEITGMSRRTLQRRLQEDGRSYSDVVQEARFELARDLLSDGSLRIIDVAMLCSYENPQHFSRAFRRIAGISPRAFREGLVAGRCGSPLLTGASHIAVRPISRPASPAAAMHPGGP